VQPKHLVIGFLSENYDCCSFSSHILNNGFADVSLNNPVIYGFESHLLRGLNVNPLKPRVPDPCVRATCIGEQVQVYAFGLIVRVVDFDLCNGRPQCRLPPEN